MPVEIILFPKPVLTISLVAGGDLAIGQEYFFAGIYQKYGGRSGAICSPPSDQISITTDAGNRSIKIEWKYSDGIGGYVNGVPPESTGITFKWDTKTLLDGSGDHIPWGDNSSLGHTKWTHQYYAGSFFTGDDKIFILSDLKSGSPYVTKDRYLSPNFAWNDNGLGNDGGGNSQPLKIGFAIDKGRIGVKITGSGNVREDIINALLSSSDYDNLYCISGFWTPIDFNAKLDLLGVIYGEGTGEIKKLGIETLAGNIITPNLDYLLCQVSQFYYLSIGDMKLIPHNCDFQVQSATIRYVLFGDNSSIKARDSTAYGYVAGWTFSELQIVNFIQASDSYARNLNFYESNMRFYFYTTGQTTDLNYNDLSFFNNGLLDYDLYIGTSFSLASDRTIFIKNCFSDRSDGKIVTSFENKPGLEGIKFQITKDIDFKITTQAGANIKNASIQIVDNDGNIYQGSTNSSGELTLEDIYIYRNEFDSLNANGLYSKNVDNGPFSLTIIKSGYADYIDQDFNINDTEKLLTLTDKIYYENNLEVEITNPDTIICDLSNADSLTVDLGG